MVARYVRDVEVPGSNPGSPTSKSRRGTFRYPFFVSKYGIVSHLSKGWMRTRGSSKLELTEREIEYLPANNAGFYANGCSRLYLLALNMSPATSVKAIAR